MTHQPTRAPDNPKLFDSTLLQHAWEFAAAGDAYAKADKLRNWMPLFFLYGRALELAMKAFVILKGGTEKEIRFKIGHELDKALANVEARGLVLSPPLDATERGALLLLNDYYSEKVLEYPLVQGYLVPQPFIVRGIVDRVIAAVFIAMWGHNRFIFDRVEKSVPGFTIDPEVNFGMTPPRGHQDVSS